MQRHPAPSAALGLVLALVLLTSQCQEMNTKLEELEAELPARVQLQDLLPFDPSAHGLEATLLALQRFDEQADGWHRGSILPEDHPHFTQDLSYTLRDYPLPYHGIFAAQVSGFGVLKSGVICNESHSFTTFAPYRDPLAWEPDPLEHAECRRRVEATNISRDYAVLLMEKWGYSWQHFIQDQIYKLTYALQVIEGLASSNTRIFDSSKNSKNSSHFTLQTAEELIRARGGPGDDSFKLDEDERLLKSKVFVKETVTFVLEAPVPDLVIDLIRILLSNFASGYIMNLEIGAVRTDHLMLVETFPRKPDLGWAPPPLLRLARAKLSSYFSPILLQARHDCMADHELRRMPGPWHSCRSNHSLESCCKLTRTIEHWRPDIVNPSILLYLRVPWAECKTGLRCLRNRVEVREALEWASRLGARFPSKKQLSALSPGVVEMNGDEPTAPLSALDILGQVRESSFIVTPHGGANYNLLFALPRTVVVELIPTKKANPGPFSTHNFFSALGLTHWMVAVPESKHFYVRERRAELPAFEVPPAKLLRIFMRHFALLPHEVGGIELKISHVPSFSGFEDRIRIQFFAFNLDLLSLDACAHSAGGAGGGGGGGGGCLQSQLLINRRPAASLLLPREVACVESGAFSEMLGPGEYFVQVRVLLPWRGSAEGVSSGNYQISVFPQNSSTAKASRELPNSSLRMPLRMSWFELEPRDRIAPHCKICNKHQEPREVSPKFRLDFLTMRNGVVEPPYTWGVKNILLLEATAEIERFTVCLMRAKDSHGCCWHVPKQNLGTKIKPEMSHFANSPPGYHDMILGFYGISQDFQIINFEQVQMAVMWLPAPSPDNKTKTKKADSFLLPDSLPSGFSAGT